MPTRIEDLTAMRELLWESIRTTVPEKRAPLFARLESVIEQIDKLSPTAKVDDPVDEVAQRRATRRASSGKASRRSAVD